MCIVYNTAHNHYVVHFMQRLIFCSVTSLAVFTDKKEALSNMVEKETWISWIHQLFKSSPSFH